MLLDIAAPLVPPFTGMGYGRLPWSGDLLVGTDLRQGVAILLTGVGVAEVVEDHRAREQRRKIERRDFEPAIDCRERAFEVARGLAHRRELDPQVDAPAACARDLLQHRSRGDEIACRSGAIGLFDAVIRHWMSKSVLLVEN